MDDSLSNENKIGNMNGKVYNNFSKERDYLKFKLIYFINNIILENKNLNFLQKHWRKNVFSLNNLCLGIKKL